jgi:hypothetical protein
LIKISKPVVPASMTFETQAMDIQQHHVCLIKISKPVSMPASMAFETQAMDIQQHHVCLIKISKPVSMPASMTFETQAMDIQQHIKLPAKCANSTNLI